MPLVVAHEKKIRHSYKRDVTYDRAGVPVFEKIRMALMLPICQCGMRYTNQLRKPPFFFSILLSLTMTLRYQKAFLAVLVTLLCTLPLVSANPVSFLAPSNSIQ